MALLSRGFATKDFGSTAKVSLTWAGANMEVDCFETRARIKKPGLYIQGIYVTYMC